MARIMRNVVRILGLGASLLVTSCGVAHETTVHTEINVPGRVPVQPGGVTVKNGIELRWELDLNASGTALDLRYRVRNMGQEPLLLGDTLLRIVAPHTYEVAPNRVIVHMDESDPNLVRFVRGRLAPAGGAKVEVMPAMRSFAPGEELSGTARIALPLKGWHPNLGEFELATVPKHAVLELGFTPGNADTDMWPLLNGEVMPVLDSTAGRTTHQLIRGASIAIPAL